MKRILVVDDDRDIGEAVQLILSEEGYQVQIVTDGHEVLDQVKAFQPDLVILDMFISGVSGTGLCAKLKKTAQTKSIPVVMMSAHSDAKQVASKAAADGFVAKPFDIEELVAIVSQLTK